ncbi:YbjN domain-containing protein [Gleimia sp. 6138-11-ORH1]|uniref:YbjN domain-containing protein n=1 Tax=Gleimia sp. 6138-11-ORH1 TaxID=2973937 RepID=UPI002167FFD1|nr:YbjN domain-containing protein [Gleimia sp. 6138-11-ORH1]MCS4484725.1 YbjN domain-containing protein [Gleimia sp. 6138-11-ORH1]
MNPPSTVDRQRLESFLNSLAGTDFDLDFREHENELVYPTESGVIFINQNNQNILQIRGQWRGISTDDDSFAALVSLVQECNLHRSGPKAYMLPMDNYQRFSVGAEVNLIVSQGATECQLASFYETALTMIMGLFQDLDRATPELVTWRNH